jgi:hypothetical protein
MTVATRRPGFVLVTILWATATASMLAGMAAVAARYGYAASRNRIAAERAHWIAIGCAHHTHAALDEMLGQATTPQARHALISHIPTRSSEIQGIDAPKCVVSIEAVGMRLDAYAATLDQLTHLVSPVVPADSVDAVVSAIAKTLNRGDRPRGAAEGLPAAGGDTLALRPRVEDVHELLSASGLMNVTRLAALIDVEPGPVTLRFAPRPVLLALPGVTETTADVILRLRVVDSLPDRLVDLLGRLPQGASDTLLASFPEFSRAAVIDPSDWIVRVGAVDGTPAITATVEWRVSLGGRVSIQRQRRLW